MKKRHERQQVRNMQKNSTIEVNHGDTEGRGHFNSEQHGLIGSPNNGMNQPDYDGKVNNRKVKISDALEGDDSGKDPKFSKKGKKKKKVSNDKEDADMLFLDQISRKDSWVKTRTQAQDFDLSARNQDRNVS